MKPEFKPYHSRKLELSIQDDCILWVSRIIVPKPRREQLLSLLHDGHSGISKMKGLARSHVWWLNIDVDIEAQEMQSMSVVSAFSSHCVYAPLGMA